jgi:LPPG:FO 2-phospho-L-lactate transferase
MVDIAEDGDVTTVGFQEYFVKRRHSVPVTGIRFDGVEGARPTFIDDITTSEAIIVAPSNPLVSIGPIRALHGVDEALTAHRDRVVAISPIVAGAALKGPADRMLSELGFEASVLGVARLYAPICGTLVIDERDAEHRDAIEAVGIRCVVTDTIMRTPEIAATLATTTLTAAREGARHDR